MKASALLDHENAASRARPAATRRAAHLVVGGGRRPGRRPGRPGRAGRRGGRRRRRPRGWRRRRRPRPARPPASPRAAGSRSPRRATGRRRRGPGRSTAARWSSLTQSVSSTCSAADRGRAATAASMLGRSGPSWPTSTRARSGWAGCRRPNASTSRVRFLRGSRGADGEHVRAAVETGQRRHRAATGRPVPAGPWGITRMRAVPQQLARPAGRRRPTGCAPTRPGPPPAAAPGRRPARSRSPGRGG